MPRRHPSKRAIKRDLEAFWPGPRESQAELELSSGIEPRSMQAPANVGSLVCETCGAPITCTDVIARDPDVASPGHGPTCNECVLMWAEQVNEQ